MRCDLLSGLLSVHVFRVSQADAEDAAYFIVAINTFRLFGLVFS